MGQIAITCLILYSLYAIVAAQNDSKVRSELAKTKWLSELFVQAEMEFEISPLASDHCRRDYDYYRTYLQNQSAWAVRMLESSEWPTVGLFTGMTDHFGNFDECLRASSADVQGQYCLVSATYSQINNTAVTHEISMHPDENLSAWEIMNIYKSNPVRVNRQNLRWALCIPRSCSPNDVQISLNRTLNPIFTEHGLHINVDVASRFCVTSRETVAQSTGYYYTMMFFGLLTSLIICSTVYDAAIYEKPEKKQDQSIYVDLLRSFSLAKNLAKLKKVPPNEYPGIHFVKIFYLLFVIYGHRFIYFVGYPTFNTEIIEDLYMKFNIELVHTNVVDIFFMVSGFLTVHFGMTSMKKGGCIYLIFSILFRWIRMVPVFFILMLFIMYIMPYTSEGPLWNYRILNEVNKCKSSWWANLLAVNNFVKTEDQCLVVSWYISTDIQLAIIGGILLYVISKNQKIGILLTSLTFMISAMISFVVAYVNNYDGLLKLYVSLLEEPRNSEQFNKVYIATYTRTGPYLLGFASAYLANTLKKRGFKFTSKQIAYSTILSILIGEGIQIYGYQFYIFGRAYEPIENGLFAAFNRSLFAFPMAWMMCMYFTSGLGIMEKIFIRKIYVPIGRLTYSVFLVNTVIQLYHSSSQKTLMPSSGKINLFWWVLGDIMASYLIGLGFYLYAETPINNLSKVLQKALLKKFVPPNRINAATSEPPKKTVLFDTDGKNETHPDKFQKIDYENKSYVNDELKSDASHLSQA